MHGMNGIVGLEGREPFGAVLAIGRKGPKGNPIENDRFCIVVTQEVDGVRPFHPLFGFFNGLEIPPEKDDDGRDKKMPPHPSRTVMRGYLVHADRDQCFEHHLKAQVLPGYQAHPAKGPHCTGDGERAKRWDHTLDDGKGGKGAYRDIECPNERCPFRQSDGNKPTPCKPWMRFAFRPRWKDGMTHPTPLTKFTSGSWNTTAAFLGFFNHIENSARELGLTDYKLFGLPFTMTLLRKKRTGDSGGRAFPIVTITPDIDILSWLADQRMRVAQIEAAQPIAALTDREQVSPPEVGADTRSHAGPTVVDVNVPQERQ